MNEVTRIHLGRQPFTASVEAHKLLKTYLAAIESEVKDPDVVEEVELRMAELLTERGIVADKVILEQDVDYLKQQLGDPRDFGDDDKEETAAPETINSRQLLRDPEAGMLAGVSAGLGAYFGIDPLLFRILFVVGVFTGGWGLLIYIALWLLVPAAKTESDRLRMRGESVTLTNIKAAVERADARGAAHRASTTVTPVINGIFRVIIKVIGLGFIVGSLAVIFALVVIRAYMAAHHSQLFQENLFPVGQTEHLLLDLALVLVGLLAVFGVLSGLAIFKRRWPIRGWVTGVLLVAFFIGLSVVAGLSVDTVHNVRDRYLSQSHTVSRAVPAFQDVTITGKDVDYRWEYADTYSVALSYFGNPDVSKIKTTVSNNLLHIDTTAYTRDRDCSMLCIFPAYNLQVIVKGPRPLSVDIPAKQAMPHIPALPQD